jgi:hypothetical protein
MRCPGHCRSRRTASEQCPGGPMTMDRSIQCGGPAAIRSILTLALGGLTAESQLRNGERARSRPRLRVVRSTASRVEPAVECEPPTYPAVLR